MIDPSSTFALMSYCYNNAADGQGTWIAKNEYEGLFTSGFGGVGARAATLARRRRWARQPRRCSRSSCGEASTR